MSKLLRETEVAEMIGMSVHWLRLKRFEGKGIPYIKMNAGRGGSVRYREEDVTAFIQERRQAV